MSIMAETPFGNETAADDEPSSWLGRLRSIDLGSALALCCFTVALLFVSFYQLESFIKPIAALGMLAGLFGGVLPALVRRRNFVLPLVLSILCLLVLLFAGSWPGSFSSTPQHMTVSLKQGGMAARQPAAEDDWVDASASAIKRGDVRLDIVSVQIAPVDLRQNTSTKTSPERYLTIRLRASYEGVVFKQTPYEPWSDRADSPSKNPPTLTDNQGRTYTQKTFESGWKAAGQPGSDALNPGHQVKDVLVYPTPVGGIEHLRLTLPASAFGLPGEFRFHIPRSMIGGL